MLPIPFDLADLATALPDVIAAIGVAFVLAFITFKSRPAPTMADALEAMQAAQAQLRQQQPEEDEGS